MTISKSPKVQSALLIVILACSCNSNDTRTIPFSKAPVTDREARYWVKYDAEEWATNVPYGSRHSRQTFDFFRPSPSLSKPVPLLVFAHAGAFLLGSKEDYLIQRFCKDFARAGFATASINYSKLSLLEGKINPQKVILEAVEDARTAILYMRENHQQLGIDPNKIFFIGYSAGGIIANHVVFTNSQEAMQYYYGNGIRYDIFDVPVHELVRGVVSISGGIMQYQDLDDADARKIRLMLIHGENDMIVPYGKDKPFSILNQRAELSLPGLTFEIGLSNKGNEREMNEVLRKFRINPGVTMPAWAFSWIRDVAFPRDICGSGCIAKGIRSRGNVTFYTISDASHAFMMNEQGDFNKTYQLVRDRIGKFVR